MTTIMTQHQDRARAHEIMGNLPTPDYPVNFQPTYPDERALLEAVHEVVHTEAVTLPRNIDSVRLQLAEAATIFIYGSCHERIEITTSIEDLAAPALDGLDLLDQSNLTNFLPIYRGMAQSTKPRSNEIETHSSGVQLVSFQGDAVNGTSVADRTPDPTRMVACAVQARDIRRQLNAVLGKHLPAAHEALLLPYEHAFVRQDPETGKLYLLSADLPWLGVRTNTAEGAHARLLGSVENPVGAKLGAATTEQDIADLSAVLNPNNLPGKIIFMPRVGKDNMDSLRTIARAIRKHSPNARVVYDMHGATYQLADGTKIRDIQDIQDEMTATAEVLDEEGLRLDGGHYETVNDDDRKECIDHAGELPTHPGEIDPRLNPSQTLVIANHLGNLA